jgi:S1-C subfamily serine protease
MTIPPIRVKLAVASVAVLTIALCDAAASARARQSTGKEAISVEARTLVRRAVASTGLISVRNSSDSSGQDPRARGSAVVVRSDGVLVTNYHVITNARTNRSYDEIFLSLSIDGETTAWSARYRVRPLLINKEFDLALLRIESYASGNPVPKTLTFPSIEIGDSRRIGLLDDLYIIGFPEKGGSSITVNRGVVEGKDILANWIKTDARVIHGNSGGAAVNSEGRLIGIPTKVEVDEQPIDKNGDGFPDDFRRYGAVGFLRPAHLVGDMIGQLSNANSENSPIPSGPIMVDSSATITVRGMVKSAVTGKPIAGALIGLLPLGENNITERTLLTWGSTNAEGAFKLNKPVPAGRYTLKAKALANQAFSRDVEIRPGDAVFVIEMRGAPER